MITLADVTLATSSEPVQVELGFVYGAGIAGSVYGAGIAATVEGPVPIGVLVG